MGDAGLIIGSVIVGAAILAIVAWRTRLADIEAAKMHAMTPEERERYLAEKAAAAARAEELSVAKADQWTYGPLNPSMICPHCQAQGYIRTKSVTRKRGISGGKATAAILTAGVSVLATGLSRKEDLTQARCGYCRNVWLF